MDLGSIDTTERGMQMLIRDNGNITFRQLDIQDACLVEKKQGEIMRGWRHYHRLQYPCDGYKGIPRTTVTISHERDIVYDPHGILSEKEKPDKGEGFDRRGISEIAQGKCYRHEHQKAPTTMLDRVTWTLIILALLFGLVILKNMV